MSVKPINNIIKDHVESIHEKANKEAEIEFSNKYNDEITKLDLFNQMKILINETEKLDDTIEKNAYPYYIKNHYSSEWLLNQFASRTFLLDVDESEQLSECIYLGTLDLLYKKKLIELKDLIPLYTYKDFINGIIDPFFSNFKRYYNMSRDDYYKIRLWQAEKLIKIVSYYSHILIHQIQNHCKNIFYPIGFIHTEREKIDIDLDSCNSNAQEIKTALSKLFIFKNKQDFSELNDELLIENFNIYKSEKLNWKPITPKNINPIIKRIDSGSNEFNFNEITLFYIINNVSQWLDDVIAGQNIFKPVEETNWNLLFSEISEEANRKIGLITDTFYEFINDPTKTKKDIKKYLIKNLDVYRHKFNAIENKDVFSILEDKDTDILKQMFITNSFFNNDIKNQTDKIIEAKVIQNILWDILCIHNEIFETRKMNYPDKNGSYYEIMHLLHQMVLDKETYLKLEKCMDDFMQHFHSFLLPYEVHFNNTREVMVNLFHKSLKRLEDILDNSNSDKKTLYLQSRLKQLKQRELEFKLYEEADDLNDKDYSYTTHLKNFLQIQSEFICNTSNIKFTTKLNLPRPTNALLLPLNTFEAILPEPKASFVLEMIESLGLTVNGVSCISERKKGSILGVVEALREQSILPQQSIDSLCKLIANKINLSIGSKLYISDISKQYKTKVTAYIKQYYNI